MATQWQRRRVGSALVGVVTPRGRVRANIRDRKPPPPAPVNVRYATEVDGLRALRAQALEELYASVKGGAEADHISGVLALLCDIDARLGLGDGGAGPPPCLATPRVRDPLVTREAVKATAAAVVNAGSHRAARHR
jgi:hypothetical protein